MIFEKSCVVTRGMTLGEHSHGAKTFDCRLRLGGKESIPCQNVRDIRSLIWHILRQIWPMLRSDSISPPVSNPLIPEKLNSIEAMDCKLKKVMFRYKFPIIPLNPKGLWGDEGKFLEKLVERLAISVQCGFEPRRLASHNTLFRLPGPVAEACGGC